MLWQRVRLLSRILLLGRLLLIVGALCVLSSCATRKSKQTNIINSFQDGAADCSYVSTGQESSGDDFLYDALACETKLSDVPVPLGSCPLPRYFDAMKSDEKCDILLGYMTQQNKDSLCTFYEREMFANGWRMMVNVCGTDSVLIFEKPNRVCAIIIGPYDTQQSTAGCNKLVIAVGYRSNESMDE